MADYPTSVTDLGPGLEGVPLGSEHPAHHTALRDEIVATQTELGTEPAGAYATVRARLAALDSLVFDVVTYGAVVDGTTDDTAAWQAALDAAGAAGGGIVTSSLAGVSVIAGALQDTGTANAQLILPDVHMLDDPQIGITIRGPFEQSSVCSVVGAADVPTSGLVLKSTLASGTGAVFGAYAAGTSYLNFTFVHLRLENLTVRTVSNPTISALDLRRVDSCTMSGVIVDTGQYDTSLTEPTTTTSYGIRLPKNNNGAHIRLRDVAVFGFYNGVEFSEHTEFESVSIGACNTGMVAVAGNHASHFGRILVGYCKYGLRFTGGAHALDVDQWDTEHAASGWYATTYDIDDASNYGKGFIRWHAVLQGVGDHNSFVVNGASGMTTSRVGAAIGGGGTTTYVHRDRLVAAAGNTVLTLGATPVASSPLVWVNNTIKWVTTDYTISGAVITFGTPLSASDVVLVQYHSTTSGYVAATLTTPGVNILDNFTRANSTTTMGSTSTGSVAWNALALTWGISSNKGYIASGASSTSGFAVVESAVADCTVSVVPTSSATDYLGLTFRATDSSNYYLVQVQVGTSSAPIIQKKVAGTTTTIATGSAITFASGDTLSVVLLGSSIIVKRNGTTIVSATDSSHIAATKHGIWCYNPPAPPSLARFDDFSIQP